MEQQQRLGAPPGNAPDGFDRAVFERVWRRVMPEDRPDCPFLLEDSPSVPEQSPTPTDMEECVAAAAMLPMTTDTAMESSVVPALPERPLPAPRHTQSTPPPEDTFCLGPGSAVYSAQLQQFIDHELADHKTYQLLSRRATGTGGRVLAAMAADERRHAKRLSTAYFLISGVRYWPMDRVTPTATGTYPAALRERFGEEQRGKNAYLAAAEETCDACLRELYLELAGDESAHAWMIRSILEQM